MMSAGCSTSCFQHNNPQSFQMYGGLEDLLSSSSSGSDTNSHTLLYNLSVLREKVQQLQSLVTIVVSPDQIQNENMAAAVAGVGALIQDIVVAASSMMYAFQQLAPVVPSIAGNEDHMKACNDHNSSQLANSEALDQLLHNLEGDRRGIFSADETHYNSNTTIGPIKKLRSHRDDVWESKEVQDVIELEAADLLAKYTYFCQVCKKGFKRDANLRMHMRAHGDEYKTSAALSNPMKKSSKEDEFGSIIGLQTQQKYSCPQEGCRWNKKHAKFQPLKSMVCVKNHYKRSHCPKMYMCNRCNRKQFSVLSDLRTHEKHCGDHVRWRCSCGTTFSRKDKLMGHVALFVGHSPAVDCPVTQGNYSDYHAMKFNLDHKWEIEEL